MISRTKNFESPHIGKRVFDNNYIHVSAVGLLPTTEQVVVAMANRLVSWSSHESYNVIKIGTAHDEVSLLDYADFFDSPFPILVRSWRVTLSSATVVFRDYSDSRNPPILHRKELLLPPDHPSIPAFAQITETAESLGLFEHTNRIGFYSHWRTLISDRGYELVGNDFVPMGNDEKSTPSNIETSTKGIQRHLTALSRYTFSAPVQALLRHGLLSDTTSFFDYGCGRGDDIRGLTIAGVAATGWDPHFASDQEKRIADVVNIGFVINVIENLDERVEALFGAYSLTRTVLSVSAMLNSNAIPDGRPFNDGFMTSRNTFQKYFTQTELRDFIEHTLDEVAVAVSPGVFFVFKDKVAQQRYFTKKYGSRTVQLVSRGWEKPKRHMGKIQNVEKDEITFNEHREIFERLWLDILQVGRIPDSSEIENLLEVETKIGSLSRALKISFLKFSNDEFEKAKESKKEDILLLLALQQFEKRASYSVLSEKAKRDIRFHFGDQKTAKLLAQKILFSLSNASEIDKACREASRKGYGWLDEGKSIQLHISLLERTPLMLRLYVNCATILCGDLSTFDLVKIHIHSGKISLLRFDDFQNSALPRLLQRVKVRFKEQELDVFDYGLEYPPTLLYGKSRFINEEFQHYAEQVEFESALNRLALFDLSGYGPSELQFRSMLNHHRWSIEGFNLVRSKQIPSIDDPCGKHFLYRDIIECGETQRKYGHCNLPKEADTYSALLDLATRVLDPVIEYFGMVRLTFGFCSPSLAKLIDGHIAPRLDQHAAYERNSKGNYICSRLGAAIDFIVEDEDMKEVANWVLENTNCDRVYYYGPDRPIHVSYSDTPAKQLVELRLKNHRLIPRVISGKRNSYR